MDSAPAGLVVWDVDGTLIPADLRWLRRAVALRVPKTPSMQVKRHVDIRG
jgi:hypothetical protein